MAVGTDILPPRYRAAKRIGHGAMGEIYRATDETLGRSVAIKILAERFAEDVSIRGRFTREALAAARLSGHPHTVTIFDVGEWNGRPFIVMEFLSGGSLDALLAHEGAQPPRRALHWLGQAAAALDHAHANGVVHRDVKPGNLLLDRDGNVHVADFGIASAAGLDSLTLTGTVLGTAGYLSPEQAQGARANPESDVYSLGVVAFELLTGERPYERESVTAEAAAHVNEPVPSACARSEKLPCELDTVFGRALAKDPAARYETCGALVGGIRNAFDDAAGKTGTLPPAAPPPPRLRREPLSVPRRRSPVRWLLLVVVLAAAAIVGAIVASALTSGGGHRSATTFVRTITTQGQTKTVTATSPAPSPPPPPPAPPPPSPPAASGTPQQLVDRATGLIRAGDYAAALPLAQQALTRLRGTGQPYEAYANYDVGTSLAHTGNCADALAYLAASERIQGHRSEIDADRAYCRSH
jgi:eukaryotic-like serine/threonine-protein kinase